MCVRLKNHMNPTTAPKGEEELGDCRTAFPSGVVMLSRVFSQVCHGSLEYTVKMISKHSASGTSVAITLMRRIYVASMVCPGGHGFSAGIRARNMEAEQGKEPDSTCLLTVSDATAPNLHHDTKVLELRWAAEKTQPCVHAKCCPRQFSSIL